MAIKVILADDHEVVRAGIKAVIERKGNDIIIIGEASNGEEVLILAKSNPADVYVLDIAMPLLNGIETIERLKKIDATCKILILSMYDDRTLVERALKNGANGYLLKETATDEIIHAIQEVYLDRYFLSPNISKYLVEGFLEKQNISKQYHTINNLTSREREILQLIAEGFNSKEMSTKLNLSLNTIHVHRHNITQRLNIHKQADLIRYALKEGISHL
jgi:DNA-binding NarL/FixJ family response regulator